MKLVNFWRIECVTLYLVISFLMIPWIEVKYLCKDTFFYDSGLNPRVLYEQTNKRCQDHLYSFFEERGITCSPVIWVPWRRVELDVHQTTSGLISSFSTLVLKVHSVPHFEESLLLLPFLTLYISTKPQQHIFYLLVTSSLTLLTLLVFIFYSPHPWLFLSLLEFFSEFPLKLFSLEPSSRDWVPTGRTKERR